MCAWVATLNRMYTYKVWFNWIPQKRQAELDEIKKTDEDFSKDRRMEENIADVKEVAISSQKRITEFKVYFVLESSIP